MSQDEIKPEGPAVEFSIHIMKMSDNSIQTPTTGEPSLADIDEVLTRTSRNFHISLLTRSILEAIQQTRAKPEIARP